VQGSGYNACTGKYCIICPGGTKEKKKLKKRILNQISRYKPDLQK
jgi:hypothetical protein